VIVAKALRRKDVLAFFAELPECLVGMEACRFGPSLGARADQAWP
jgi:transposase